MPDSEFAWIQLVTEKAPEVWLSVSGGVIYVWHKSGAATRMGRAIEAGVSGLLSLVFGPDVALVTGYPATLIHFIIAVFGFMILDVVASLFMDKKELSRLLKSIIFRYYGVDPDRPDSSEKEDDDD